MRRFTQLLTALVFCSLVIFISCKKKNKEEDPDPRDEVAAALLSATWVPSEVTFDGSNRTEWEGFSIGFSYNNETDQGGYSVSGVPTEEGAEASDVWGDNVTWTFDGEDESANTGTIVRSDGVSMTATLDNPDTPTQLRLEFSVEDPGARVAGFYGTWVFVLVPQ